MYRGDSITPLASFLLFLLHCFHNFQQKYRENVITLKLLGDKMALKT